MKKVVFLPFVLLGFSLPVAAASPSSVAAQNGVNPSTVTSNGGFDFQARDDGKHLGWCKGQGHLAPPGNAATGHRNHQDCEEDPPVDVDCPEWWELVGGVCVEIPH